MRPHPADQRCGSFDSQVIFGKSKRQGAGLPTADASTPASDGNFTIYVLAPPSASVGMFGPFTEVVSFEQTILSVRYSVGFYPPWPKFASVDGAVSGSYGVSSGERVNMYKFGMATTFVPTSLVTTAMQYEYMRTSWYAFVVWTPMTTASKVGFYNSAVVEYASVNFLRVNFGTSEAKGPGSVLKAGAPSVVSEYGRSTSLSLVVSASHYEFEGSTTGERNTVLYFVLFLLFYGAASIRCWAARFHTWDKF